MQRVAIVGEGPAALSTAERLLSAGMCVDLISEKNCTVRSTSPLRGACWGARGSRAARVRTWYNSAAALARKRARGSRRRYHP